MPITEAPPPHHNTVHCILIAVGGREGAVGCDLTKMSKILSIKLIEKFNLYPFIYASLVTYPTIMRASLHRLLSLITHTTHRRQIAEQMKLLVELGL